MTRTARFTRAVIIAHLAFGWPAAAQVEPSAAEVRAHLMAHLPRSGCVECVYAPSKRGAAEANVGFDAATGAWYIASNTSASLKPLTGGLLLGEPRIGGLKASSAFPGHSSDLGLIDWIPVGVLRGVALGHLPINSVERAPEGGFVFAIQADQVIKGSPRLFCEVDASGVLRRTWRDDPKDRRETTIQYSERSPAGFPIPVRAAGLELATLTFMAEPRPGMFAPDRVESLSAQARVNVGRALAALGEGSGGADGAGASGSVSGPPTAPSPLSKYRWPLVVLGLLMLVVGVWYRLRRVV